MEVKYSAAFVGSEEFVDERIVPPELGDDDDEISHLLVVSNVTLVKEVQFENALGSIVFTEAGITMLVSAEQP